jgi:ATP-binding cassette subfamily B multidrug efflux pump
LVLRQCSLVVPGGAKLAICGRTGGGKSSLFAAITRLYPIAGGQILVAGVDVRDVPLRELREAVLVVGQTPVLLGATLRDNLGAMSDAAARAALSGVGLTQARFQDLDLAVGPGGCRLSQGERQLVLLARAVAARPRIVLCDEATASVDPATDALVHNALLGLRCTVVSILHRVDRIPLFDLVAVVAHGRIVHVGPAAEFVAGEWFARAGEGGIDEL